MRFPISIPVDGQSAQRDNSAALTPPGPVMSPDDPRYGRSEVTPVYSDRARRPGPVISPEVPLRPPGPTPYQFRRVRRHRSLASGGAPTASRRRLRRGRRR